MSTLYSTDRRVLLVEIFIGLLKLKVNKYSFVLIARGTVFQVLS